jgi:hypothetical protein
MKQGPMIQFPPLKGLKSKAICCELEEVWQKRFPVISGSCASAVAV